MKSKNKSKGCRNVKNKARYTKLSDILIIPGRCPVERFGKISKYFLNTIAGKFQSDHVVQDIILTNR